PAESAFTVPSGPVPAGTMAGLRFEVQGMVRGRPAIVLEHVTRLRPDIAPQWPQPAGAGCYRVVIEGVPSMICDLQLRGAGGDHTQRRSRRPGEALPDRDPGGVRGEAGAAGGAGPAALQRARPGQLKRLTRLARALPAAGAPPCSARDRGRP